MRQRDDVNIQGAWLAGFALFATWGLGTLGNWRGVGDALTGTVGALSPLPALQSAALALLIAAFGLSYSRWEHALFSKGALAGATLGGIATSILIAAAPLSPSALIALAFLLQISFKYLLFVWFRAFSRFDIEIVLLYVPTILGCALMLSGLLDLLSALPRGTVAIACAVGQLVCLRRINAAAPLPAKDGKRCPTRTLTVVLVISFVFCILFRLIGSAAKRPESEPVLGTFCAMFYAEFGVGTMLLGALILTTAFLGRKQAARSFTALPFALAGGLFGAWVVLCLTFPDCRNFSLRGLGQLSVDLTFVLFFLLLGKHLDCSGFQLFVFDEAVFAAAYLVSGPLTIALHANVPSALFEVMTAVLILSAQSVVVFFFIMGRIILRNGLSDNLRIIVEAPETTRNARTEAERAPQEQSEGCGAPHHRPKHDGGQLCPTDSDILTDNPAAVAAADSPNESPGRSESRESTIGAVARTYGLSERETEVMALLVKGRSMKRAAEELYLSLGTVNTYAKRIYAKLDIHTRQELIDRFDDFREKTRSA